MAFDRKAYIWNNVPLILDFSSTAFVICKMVFFKILEAEQPSLNIYYPNGTNMEASRGIHPPSLRKQMGNFYSYTEIICINLDVTSDRRSSAVYHKFLRAFERQPPRKN